MNCEEVRNRIAQMSRQELRTAAFDLHVIDCEKCRSYVSDIQSLTESLDTLVIPRPDTLVLPHGMQVGRRQSQPRNLVIAAIAAVLITALATAAFYSYAAKDPSEMAGTKTVEFTGHGEARRVKSPQNGQLEREQSKSSPSTPSRN